MPRDTLWPLAKNCVKYGLVLVGGRTLYLHTLGARGSDTFPDRTVSVVRDEWLGADWAKILMGLLLLLIVHYVLRDIVRKKQQLERLKTDSGSKGGEAEEEDEDENEEAAGKRETAETGNVILAGASQKIGFRLLFFFLRELPKIVLGTAGAVCLMKGTGFLDGWYMQGAEWLHGRLQDVPLLFASPDSLGSHIVKAFAGLVVIELGYAIITRGIKREHGPLYRSAYVDDRRVESVHWDTMKIRGFGMQLQTRSTEGIIADTTPTADVAVRIYTPQGSKKGIKYVITYLQNLEPVEKRLEQLRIEDIKLVKEALSSVAGGALGSKEIAGVDVEALRNRLKEKTDGQFKDQDLARVLLAIERIGAEDIEKLKDSALLDEVNDREVGFEGGLFSRTLYKADTGGHLTPVATMVEDLTLTDQISSSPRNGYGPDYWRQGKVLMGFKFFKGYGEDGTAMRTVIHEIVKSRTRRYWDFGDSYLWTYREQTFFVDNCWIASYGWLMPGHRIPRRKYIVRDSKMKTIAIVEEVFHQKLLLDMDWRVTVFDSRLDSRDATYVLTLLTEFLHSKHKYVRARTWPGNTAHERLLVSGGRKRGDAGGSLVGGV